MSTRAIDQVEAAIARIEATDARVNAFTARTFDRARAEAAVVGGDFLLGGGEGCGGGSTVRTGVEGGR